MFEAQQMEVESKQDKLRPDTGAPRFCIYCGAPLEDGDVFCCECGSRIETEASKIVPAAEISSDRMASIMETQQIKAGIITDKFRKSKFLERTKTLLPGYYVYEGQYMTQHLSIDEVQGNSVRATVKTNFRNLSYSTEFYEGSFSDGRLVLHITTSDLHPITGFSIMLSEGFTGEVVENSISGIFTGEFSNSVVFKKIN